MPREVELEHTSYEIRFMDKPNHSILVGNAETEEKGRDRLAQFVGLHKGCTYRLYAVHWQILDEQSG